MVPKDTHILEDCEYNTQHDKRDFTGMIKLSLLRWELILDYPGGPKVITGSESERIRE